MPSAPPFQADDKNPSIGTKQCKISLQGFRKQSSVLLLGYVKNVIVCKS
jgi:hypothetical protein